MKKLAVVHLGGIEEDQSTVYRDLAGLRKASSSGKISVIARSKCGILPPHMEYVNPLQTKNPPFYSNTNFADLHDNTIVIFMSSQCAY